MDKLLKMISQADAEEIDILLDAVMKKKRELYPEWELVYYAQPRGEKVDMEYLEKLLENKE